MEIFWGAGGWIIFETMCRLNLNFKFPVEIFGGLRGQSSLTTYRLNLNLKISSWKFSGGWSSFVHKPNYQVKTSIDPCLGRQSSFDGGLGLEICRRGLKMEIKKLNIKPTDQHQGGTGLILTKRSPPPPGSTTWQRVTLQGNSLMQQFKKLLQKDWGEHYSRPSMASPIPSKLHPLGIQPGRITSSHYWDVPPTEVFATKA